MTELLSGRRTRRFALRATPEQALELSWGAATDVGLRRHVNEDSLIAVPGVFAVADGLGGHSAGDVASALVVASLARAAKARARRRAILRDGDVDAALARAGAEIVEATSRSVWGSGTTVAGLAVVERDGVPALEVFNVGDSRVYRLDDGTLTQLTVDHSFVQDLVNAGQLRQEDAEFHPDANVITRAVGFGERPEIDRWTVHPSPGMRLLACTDGLTREVSHAVLRALLGSGASPQATADALVAAAVTAGGRDNVTVVVLDVIDAPTVLGDGSQRAALSDAGTP